VIAALTVVVVLVIAAVASGETLFSMQDSADPYNLQTDGFLKGRLDLPIEIPAGFARLPDPYDAMANSPYRGAGLHDLSYFDGRLYSYFGPTPSVLLFLPYRLFHLGDLPVSVGTLIFAVVGYVVLLLAMLRMRRSYLLLAPSWVDPLMAIALGLCLPLPFLVYLGRVYELAIVAAFACLSAALYCSLRAWQAKEPWCWRWQAAAWAALALGVGARPIVVLAAPALAFTTLLLARRQQSARRVRALVATLLPATVIGGLLLAFNAGRFGSITEFGETYQLAGATLRDYPMNEWANLPQGLATYLFAVPRVIGEFPFLALRTGGWDVVPPISYSSEPVAGLLIVSPFLLVFGVAFAWTWRPMKRQSLVLFFVSVSALTYAVAVLFFISFRFPGATMRYLMDIAPWLMTVALLSFAVLLRTDAPKANKRWLVPVATAAVVVGSIFNLAFGLHYESGSVHADGPRPGMPAPTAEIVR
jgi:4-amino-4-deoxy-L-arabinose transferase-like glycosyltransferase